MTSQLITFATRVTNFQKPSGTSFVEIYNAANTTRAVFDHINIACHISGAYTVAINDGATDWLLADAVAVTANAAALSLEFGQPILLRDWSVKVKSSVANAFTFMLVMQEVNRMSIR